MRLVCGVSLALLLAGLTHGETARWQSDRALWCHALTLAPEKVRPLNNCALALMRDGEYAAALPLLQRAAVLVDEREPNRRASLRMAVLSNQFVTLWAVRETDAARVVWTRMDPDDPRTQRFSTWLDSTR